MAVETGAPINPNLTAEGPQTSIRKVRQGMTRGGLDMHHSDKTDDTRAPRNQFRNIFRGTTAMMIVVGTPINPEIGEAMYIRMSPRREGIRNADLGTEGISEPRS